MARRVLLYLHEVTSPCVTLQVEYHMPWAPTIDVAMPKPGVTLTAAVLINRPDYAYHALRCDRLQFAPTLFHASLGYCVLSACPFSTRRSHPRIYKVGHEYKYRSFSSNVNVNPQLAEADKGTGCVVKSSLGLGSSHAACKLAA